MSIRQVARAAAVVALFGILSRVLGFVREIVLAGVYGATADTDALVNALFVVNTVAAVLLYVLVTLMIPVFQQERERAGAQSAWALLWAIVGWIGMCSPGWWPSSPRHSSGSSRWARSARPSPPSCCA